MERNLDCINRQKNNNRLYNYFVNRREQNSVVDSFRFNCPADIKYTWFRHNPSLIASKLYMIWIFHSLLQCTGPTFFKPSYKFDHSLLGINCKCYTFVSANGYYKYNTSLLRNGEYVNETKQSALDITDQSEDKILITDKPGNSLK